MGRPAAAPVLESVTMARPRERVILPINFPDLDETKAILQMVGVEGVSAYIFLLCRARGGLVKGAGPAEIEELASWDGKPGMLFEVLLAVGWVERVPKRGIKVISPDSPVKKTVSETMRMRHRMAALRRWHGEKAEVVEEARKRLASKKKRKPRAQPIEEYSVPPEIKEDMTKKEEQHQAEKEKALIEAARLPGTQFPENDFTQIVKVEEEVKLPAVVGDERELPVADMVLNAWNRLAEKKGLVKARRLNPTRRTALRSRLKDKGWDWRKAITRLEARLPDLEAIKNHQAQRGFLQGGEGARQNAAGRWRADIEFFLRPATVDKILEGNYDVLKETGVSTKGSRMASRRPGSTRTVDERNQDAVDEFQKGMSWAERMRQKHGDT